MICSDCGTGAIHNPTPCAVSTGRERRVLRIAYGLWWQGALRVEG